MAIGPVSGVSFRNNNVSFEGRRNKKHPEYNRHSTSPIKAISLAALIAMSPVVDTYANEPYINNPAYVQELQSAQKYGKVPLPSNFSYINKFVVDMPNGDKLGLYFIDTDSDKNDYEMFEYIRVSKNNEAIKRGIIKQIYFRSDENGKSVRLHGIGLSTTDSDNYAPDGEMYDFVTSSDLYDFFNRIINENSNNSSISRLPKGASYGANGTHGKFMQEYKRALGIIK